jgi:hypothetical protein
MHSTLRIALKIISHSRIKETTTARSSSIVQKQKRQYQHMQKIQKQQPQQNTMADPRRHYHQDLFRWRIFDTKLFPFKGSDQIQCSYYQPDDTVAIPNYDNYDDDNTRLSSGKTWTGTLVNGIEDHNELILCSTNTMLDHEKQQQKNIDSTNSDYTRKRKRTQQQQIWNVKVHGKNYDDEKVANKKEIKCTTEDALSTISTIKSKCNTNTNYSELETDKFHILFGYSNGNMSNRKQQITEPATLTVPPVIDIVLTSTTDNFRRIANKYSYIPHQSFNGCIIEIGCSTGETSRLLWQRMSHKNQNKQSPKSSCWIGFDTSKQMIETMQQNIIDDDTYYSIHRSCICMNPLSNPGAAIDYIQSELLKTSDSTIDSVYTTGSPLSPTIVFIDIGGNRDEYSVLQMIQWIIDTNLSVWSSSVQLVVVKSEQVVSTLLTNFSTNNSSNSNLSSCSINGSVDNVSGILTNGTEWLCKRIEKFHEMSNAKINSLYIVETTTTSSSASAKDTTIEPILEDDGKTTPCLRTSACTVQSDTTTTDIETHFSTSNVQSMNSFFPKHPLQAPKRYYYRNSNNSNNNNLSMESNERNNASNGILICRYHNYHKDGCKRYKDPNGHCPFDHDHCHLCLQYGHTALQCKTAVIRRQN